VYKLPRATGTPDRRAKAIIKRINDYAVQPPSDDVDKNAERIRGLHHILDAAHDALRMGLAVVNAHGPGKLSYRGAEERLGIHRDTVQAYVREGRGEQR
jgi:hypothetical protein